MKRCKNCGDRIESGKICDDCDRGGWSPSHFMAEAGERCAGSLGHGGAL